MKPVLVAPGMSAVMAACSGGETVSPTDPLTGTGKHGGDGTIAGTVRVYATDVFGPGGKFSQAGLSSSGVATSHGRTLLGFGIRCAPALMTCFQVSSGGEYVDISEASDASQNGQDFTLTRTGP
jgi:hypothetical protein